MIKLTYLLLGAALADEPQEINLTERTSFSIRDRIKIPENLRIPARLTSLNFKPLNLDLDLHYSLPNQNFNINPNITINKYSNLNENMYPGIRSEPSIIYLEFKF
ncbi:MAG: hypothetical protein ISS01_02680 [Nanoarchaeota archaeon]|nr:hypothetical protein [Nanoarchaeota archaeon]